MDKFNRHLHQHDGDQHFRVETVTKFWYDTILLAFAALTDGQGNFLFVKDNWNYDKKNVSPTMKIYDVPIDFAVIKHVWWNPHNAKVYINDEEYNTESIIGATLKKGDKIRATYKPNVKEMFVLEAVVAIPILSRV